MSNALIGSNRLDTRKSSNSKIPLSFTSGIKFGNFTSDQTLKDSAAAIPRNHPEVRASRVIFGRENPLCSSSQGTMGSSIPTTLENAAKNDKTKNRKPTICPPGILPNAMGSVTNIKPGSPSGVKARGVTQNDFAEHIETPNAVYIDEGYVAAPQAQLFAMFDLERVEILNRR